MYFNFVVKSFVNLVVKNDFLPSYSGLASTGEASKPVSLPLLHHPQFLSLTSYFSLMSLKNISVLRLLTVAVRMFSLVFYLATCKFYGKISRVVPFDLTRSSRTYQCFLLVETFSKIQSAKFTPEYQWTSPSVNNDLSTTTDQCNAPFSIASETWVSRPFRCPKTMFPKRSIIILSSICMGIGDDIRVKMRQTRTHDFIPAVYVSSLTKAKPTLGVLATLKKFLFVVITQFKHVLFQPKLT